MLRVELMTILDNVAPTYSVGQKTGECLEPYLVLRINELNIAIDNDIGGWQNFEVLAYVPIRSIEPLDGLVSSLITTLKSKGFEFGGATPDYPDTNINAYMRSVRFRKPKGI
jgi:hypothetical protein